MEQISELCNISMSEIEALNPQYRTHLIPGETKPCTLRLPSTALGSFISKQDTIYTYRLDELQSKRRVVEVQTVTSSRSASSRSRATSSKSTANASSKSSSGTQHTIRKGETLGEIARKNHTTVSKLQQLNGIKGTQIRAGQTIRVK